ncbi:hypothetical protein [Aureimonas pseudogalii]|uniref:Uncharacterized protein n=1 Tax=Aureimonas pseudogalii TaxID=1744844 RepID=A0A7W6H3R2_9HYPH|nr:hypothetical protein [Aureimonas pseudogalii]MBB3998371.1 hypothetical protein [Aureimonas pseudogalii]
MDSLTRGSPRPGAGSGGAAASGADRCDFRFDADLESVDPTVLATVPVGTACTVILHRQGSYDVVVVVAPSGGFVGTLSGFRGLANLIDCIRGGNVYSATVTAKTANTCRVRVARTPTP